MRRVDETRNFSFAATQTVEESRKNRANRDKSRPARYLFIEDAIDGDAVLARGKIPNDDSFRQSFRHRGFFACGDFNWTKSLAYEPTTRATNESNYRRRILMLSIYRIACANCGNSLTKWRVASRFLFRGRVLTRQIETSNVLSGRFRNWRGQLGLTTRLSDYICSRE